MGYDCGDSCPFDFEPNGIPFGSNREENCHHDHIPFNLKGIGNIVFSVYKIPIKHISLNAANELGECVSKLITRGIARYFSLPITKSIENKLACITINRHTTMRVIGKKSP